MSDIAVAPDCTPPSGRTILTSRIALGIAVLVLLYGVARLIAHATVALGYPYDLDYGEGVVWQQMRNIVAGSGYAPLGLFPAIAYEYPPLYHVTVAATASLFGLDELFAGRLVSLVATFVSAPLLGAITARAIGAREDRSVRVTASVAAGLCFLGLPVLLTWAALMRVDMLACALTLLGMLLAIRAAQRPAAAIGAGLAFAAALYAKQTCLPAPAAAFAVLLIVRPKSAWLLAGSAVVAGLVALASLSIVTHGQFLVHILFYNLNRIVWSHALALILVLAASIVTLAVGAICFIEVVRRLDLTNWRMLRDRLRQDPSLVAVLIIILTLLIKTAMLPAVLKSGASDNYLIDWLTQIAMLFGIALVPVIRAASRRGGTPNPIILLLLAVGLPVQALDPSFLPDTPRIEADRIRLAAVVERIRASPKPVITDDMVLLLRAGKPVQWEPAITAELGSAGEYDERAFAAKVRHGDIGFFVTRGDRGSVSFDQRFNPVVADAMDAAYPKREQVGDLVLHLPSDRPAAHP